MTEPNATVPKEVIADANKPGDQPQTHTPADTPRPTQLPEAIVEPAKQENAIKTLPVSGAEPKKEDSRPARPEARPHAFVVMPFGKKKGGDGSLYDFNAIYKTLIGPALEEYHPSILTLIRSCNDEYDGPSPRTDDVGDHSRRETHAEKRGVFQNSYEIHGT